MMKKGLSVLCVVLMFVVISSCSKKQEARKGPAAVVNGEEISMEAFQKRLKQRLEFHRKNASKVDEKELKNAVINEMISERLLLEAAKEKGIEVNDEEIDKAIKEYKKRNGKKLEDYLKKWNISEEEFKREVKNQMLINKLIAELVPEDSIKEEDIKDYYKNAEKPLMKPERVEVKLIQIMDEKEAKKIVEEIKKKGMDFDRLGEKLKKENKAIVSDYGWVQPRFFRGEIGDALKTLKEGEVGGPYPGKEGFYILKIRKREKARPMTYEEAKEQIKRILLNKRRQAMKTHIVQERKKKAKIVVNVS